jgi:uncharacterized protein (TIGR01777 family)
MRIVIAGGTGFLGLPLASSLARDEHDVVILTRGAASPSGRGEPRSIARKPNGDSRPWASAVDGARAVINLAGESIAGKRWSAPQKQRILDSRVLATRSLVAAIAKSAAPPPLLISGSAVGYYGLLGDEIVTEESPAGSDFLAGVCVQWEAEAMRAASDRTRVVCMRTGVVLERDGGALPPMLLPFKLGAGGPVGSGRQYWPWIHRSDWIALVRWALETSTVSGPVNATAPNPVTNADFARALGRAMHRPAFMPAPAFALRLMLGEMADALVLSGQRALPAKAQSLGFGFKYARVHDALRAIFR